MAFTSLVVPVSPYLTGISRIPILSYSLPLFDVTYFEGDEKLGLEPDLEAKDFWLKYLPEERVIGCNAKDNFWEVGTCIYVLVLCGIEHV